MFSSATTKKSIVVDILTASFEENRSVNYVVKQDSRRKERIRRLMEYSFNVCNAFGEVWLSKEEKACALILYPDRKMTTLGSILWDARLALYVIGIERVAKVLARETKVKAFHAKEPFTYLWFIGVLPDQQNKGIGSLLLKEIINRSAESNRSVYLETSVDRNLSWYSNYGFQVYQTLELNYTLYLMRRVQRY